MSKFAKFSLMMALGVLNTRRSADESGGALVYLSLLSLVVELLAVPLRTDLTQNTSVLSMYLLCQG